MLPAQVFSSLCELSPADAVATLEKSAAMPGFVNELLSPTTPVGGAARNGLIGAGIGGLLGAIREGRKGEQDRDYGGGVARGALFGGLLGGGGTLAANAGAEWLKPTEEAARTARIQNHDTDIVNRANHNSRILAGDPSGAGTPSAPVGPLADKGVLGNALASDVMPPSLQLLLNPSSGGGVIPAAKSLIPGFDTPQAAVSTGFNGTGAFIGAGLGGAGGARLSRYFTGKGLGKGKGATNFLLGWLRGGLRDVKGAPTTGRLIGGGVGATVGAGIGGMTGQAIDHNARQLFNTLNEAKK